MKAKLAFLTVPEPGCYILNISHDEVRGSIIETVHKRFNIDMDQVRGIHLATAKILCREIAA